MVNIVTDVRFYVKEYVKIGSSPSPHLSVTSEFPRIDRQRRRGGEGRRTKGLEQYVLSGIEAELIIWRLTGWGQDDKGEYSCNYLERDRKMCVFVEAPVRKRI